MIFESDEQAIKYIRANQSVSPYIEKARNEARELFALVEGDGFKDELIKRIEHIEGTKKAIARKKYSRSIVDLYQRISQPISNVFSATGGSAEYNIDNEDKKKEFLLKIGNIRDNKSIKQYAEDVWMPLYHTDPNGVVFMEYTTEAKHGKNDVYPTYKSINKIRSYIPEGQNLSAILFEPKHERFLESSEETQLVWRLVDDKKDYTFIQRGDAFILDEVRTFEHPFGKVPGIINSDIIKIGSVEFRLSPYHKIKELTREYARDQSIKTIYKFLQGFPIHWRYVTQCKPCQGTGKEGNGKCKVCDGKGIYQSKDVTDQVNITMPKSKDDVIVAPDITGFISPDLETWKRYDEENALLEFLSMGTHWGSHKEKSQDMTATEVWIDVQPVTNKLCKYARTTEYFINWMSNMVYAYQNPGAAKPVSNYNLGKRYIIESPDVILEKYQKSKEKGDAITILDRLYNEYLTSKYENDPEWLRFELLKSEVEPYLHYTLEEISTIFGQKEAMRKALFVDWWQIITNEEKLINDGVKLRKMFDAWIEQQNLSIAESTPEVPDEI